KSLDNAFSTHPSIEQRLEALGFKRKYIRFAGTSAFYSRNPTPLCKRIIVPTVKAINIRKIITIATVILTSSCTMMVSLKAFTMYKIGLKREIFCQKGGSILIL